MDLNGENKVMDAVMHLQRAMKRGFSHGGRQGERPECGPKGPGRRHGHGMSEGRLLFALSQKESMTTSELIEMLDIRPSSMSELLSGLEERELIVRTQSEGDRRVNTVSLSEKAKEIRSRFAEERKARMEAFSSCFTEEEAAEFCRLCAKLSDHLESLGNGK